VKGKTAKQRRRADGWCRGIMYQLPGDEEIWRQQKAGGIKSERGELAKKEKK